MRKFYSRILIILVIFAPATSGLSAVTNDTLPFIGGSFTASKRDGLGLFAGAVRLACETGWQSCLGFGAHTGYRFTDPSTSFLEVGAGGLFIVLPMYMGVGVRFKEDDVTGGQLSLATGIYPVFLTVRAFNESSGVSGEVSLALFWAFGDRPGTQKPSR
jgi:hypothetical protein